MRPIPLQVVVAVPGACFVRQPGAKRVRVDQGYAKGVLVEARNKVRVWAKDEVRAGNVRYQHSRHEMVVLVWAVVQATDCEGSIYRHRRRDWHC